ncbi:hypothetical protein [Phytomonospora endophytica]|uniref:Uncharacterized protein n=1 Tax=Phytomonospora endophytica TaxID=714109 RepID=A0A841FAR4_9ACTN|nr:hypothetical protein [Phytomonospora endophytica]MBB6032854.1 hypothetical protein [Phytomonospora endophytica]GIG65080.1 hypothetical protein Pen01_13750 [Phytomonospora endophytica]
MSHTDVDVSSLEGFHANLSNRRIQIETVINKMNELLKDKPPALGAFQHAEENKELYSGHYAAFADRINRLMEAVVAAEAATGTILQNYKTAEQLSTLSADSIASRMDEVDTSLTGGGA